MRMVRCNGYYGFQSTTKTTEPTVIQEHNKMMKKQTSLLTNADVYSRATKTKKSEEAAEKHAVAERIRRERINRHLNRLRQLFPYLSKTDKASVLTETVRKVKEMRSKAADRLSLHRNAGEGSGGVGGAGTSLFLPTENDEATVKCSGEGGDRRTVIATVCCDDRPGLNRELTAALNSVGVRAVRAEMATAGGRTKTEVVVRWLEVGGGGEEDVVSLRRALKAVVENRTSGRSGLAGRVLNRSYLPSV